MDFTITVKPSLLPCIALLLSVLTIASAHGHALWSPEGLTPPRTNASNIKSGPCGAARTGNPTVLPSGATITVEFESTIFHEGEFRIAFSEADDLGFDEHVLADNIIDYDGLTERSHEITLPDIECDQCTLQLIQVMRDRNPPSNYFSCADIALVRASLDDTRPAGVTAFTAVPGDAQAMLSWSNPPSDDFAGVVVLQQLAEVDQQPIDGQVYSRGDALGEAEVIYSGPGDSATALNLPPGESAYFAAFTYNQDFYYSTAVNTSVEIAQHSPNFAPTVSLDWIQRMQQSHTGKADNSGSGGEVVITATVADDNPDDKHTYLWSSMDVPLSDSALDTAKFVFDPQGIESGLYEFQVSVTDDGEPPLSSTASVFIELSPEPRGGGGNLSWWILLSLGGLWLFRRNLQQRQQ